MRRLAAALLCAVLLLATGCAYAVVTDQQAADEYLLYFQEADLSGAAGGDALRAEKRQLESAETWNTAFLAEQLVTELLNGPQDETLKGVVPAGTVLLSLELEGSRAKVDLSSSYRILSGVSLTLADYAITLTLTQLPEISSVSITVRGEELAYRDTQRFDARDLLMSTNEDVVGTVTAQLYFLSEGGLLLTEERTLDLYEGDSQADAVVEALAAGPTEKTLYPVLPEGFQVKSVWLEENVCYVNLPTAALAEIPAESRLDLALRALVRSLSGLETVDEVRFLVDGEFAESYGGVTLTAPYTRK